MAGTHRLVRGPGCSKHETGGPRVGEPPVCCAFAIRLDVGPNVLCSRNRSAASGVISGALVVVEPGEVEDVGWEFVPLEQLTAKRSREKQNTTDKRRMGHPAQR